MPVLDDFDYVLRYLLKIKPKGRTVFIYNHVLMINMCKPIIASEDVNNARS